MKTFSKDFQTKSTKDLEVLAMNCDQLTLDAKLAVDLQLKERSAQEEISMDLLAKLNACIESDKDEISSLSFLNRLGLDLIETNGRKVIRCSGSFIVAHVFGVIFSFIIILNLLFSSFSWVELYYEFSVAVFFGAVGASVVGVVGLAIFIKVLDRLITMSAFRIEKSDSKLVFKCRNNWRTEHHEFPIGSTLSIKKEDELVLLFIDDGQENKLVKQFKKIHTVAIESLEGMVQKFNVA